jgi:lipopolysaccharide export system permease protein
VKLIDRYLARAVLWYALLVVAVLMVLSSLFVFISEQREVGTGNYTLADAVVVTLLDAPTQLGAFLPLGALIGALLGLGQLARGSELIVLRAAGVSVLRIGAAAALAGLVLSAMLWTDTEYLAPPLEHYAQVYKTFAKSSGLRLAGGSNNWVKDGDRLISVEQQSGENIFGGVYSFTLVTEPDGTRRLATVAHADSATLIRDHLWRVDNLVATDIGPDRVTVRHLLHDEVTSSVNPQFLGLAVVDPDALPARGIYRYIQHLHGNGLDARLYEVAFWTRIARTLAVILVCVLAVPFVFGPLRSSGAGGRMMIGIGIGVAYFLATRMLENSGQVYGLNPLFVGWAPTVALGIAAAIGLARTG